MSRIPHADRPAARAFCTCPRDEHDNPRTITEHVLDEHGEVIQSNRVKLHDPDCILHGLNAERSPF